MGVVRFRWMLEGLDGCCEVWMGVVRFRWMLEGLDGCCEV